MTSPPEVETSVGMGAYGSGTPRCRARIKRDPEDFQVEESLYGVEVESSWREGLLPLYRVEKRGMDTLHLERELAAVLKSRVSFAGMKDKRAVAVQFVTPTSSRAERPPSAGGHGFTATLAGYVNRPVTRGMVAANSFRVVLRECCGEMAETVAEVRGTLDDGRLPNYYGLQRFGGSGALTHRVGAAILRGKFAEAVELMLLEPRSSDDERAMSAREAFARGMYSDGASLLPRGRDVEKAVARRLEERAGDHLAALRAVPINLRKLYTQAYQSYLFNRALTMAMNRGLDIANAEAGDNWGEVSPDGMVLRKVHGVKEPMAQGAVPLFQFAGYAYRNYGSRFDSCLEEVMAEEGVRPREFYSKEMQELSVEGGFRRPGLTAREFSQEQTGDTMRLGFRLARGEYATVLLREIVKPDDPVSQGFA